jgi:two-component system OmpR family sensor kinase
MFPSAGDELAVKPAGVAIAVSGFVVSRGLLSGAGEPTAVGPVVPLAVGLGIVVYGASLSVSTHSRRYARTVGLWYLLGTLGSAALVAAGSGISLTPFLRLVTDATVVSSAVVGGGAGILIGTRSGRNQRQRQHLAQQTHQVTLLQRMLRHEVLNGLTAIRGHAGLLTQGEDTGRSLEAVESNADRIQRTVEDVGFLVRTVDDTAAALGAVDLSEMVTRCKERLPADDGRVVVTEPVPSVMVRGDDHLDTVVAELVTMALDRTEDGTLTLDVTPATQTVDLTLTAPGDWLTEVERTVLLEGPPEYDRPDIGYGVSIVRLLVARYGGTLRITEDGDDLSVTAELLRTTENPPPGESPGVVARDLRYAALAGLGAGVVMGGLLQVFTGGITVIGALYGGQSLAVGWVAHLFHSMLFSAVLVGALQGSGLERVLGTPHEALGFGVGYGALLWLVGAGLVMPAWLNAAGIATPIPNLQLPSLAVHLIWGGVLSVSLHLLPITRSS